MPSLRLQDHIVYDLIGINLKSWASPFDFEEKLGGVVTQQVAELFSLFDRARGVASEQYKRDCRLSVEGIT